VHRNQQHIQILLSDLDRPRIRKEALQVKQQIQVNYGELISSRLCLYRTICLCQKLLFIFTLSISSFHFHFKRLKTTVGVFGVAFYFQNINSIPTGHNFPRQAFSTIKALHKLTSLHNQKKHMVSSQKEKHMVEKMVIKKQVRESRFFLKIKIVQLNKKISEVKVNKPHQQQLRQIHHDSDSNQQ
jgi:hypothetical protein